MVEAALSRRRRLATKFVVPAEFMTLPRIIDDQGPRAV